MLELTLDQLIVDRQGIVQNVLERVADEVHVAGVLVYLGGHRSERRSQLHRAAES